MAKSSIHIATGNSGFLSHNDRSRKTKNTIFPEHENEIFNDAKSAFGIYREELKKRSAAYTNRTGQKLQKKAITHLSAIVNLNENHTMEDLKKLGSFLEKKLDTKIFQMAIHRDEGHVDHDEKIVNYHAHIEFLGLDTKGQSIRKKLDRKTLIELQDQTAKILEMKRGINYTRAKEKRPKRLDTYEYKHHAERMAVTHTEFKNQKRALIKEANKRIRAAADHPVSKGMVEKLIESVTGKQLKKEISELRAKLKEQRASRAEYAKLEQLNRDLKAQIKAKTLTNESMQEQISSLKGSNLALEAKIEHLEGQSLDISKEKLKTLARIKMNLEQITLERKANEAISKLKTISENLEKEKEHTSKLKNQIEELGKENTELKAENTKLHRIVEVVVRWFEKAKGKFLHKEDLDSIENALEMQVITGEREKKRELSNRQSRTRGIGF